MYIYIYIHTQLLLYVFTTTFVQCVCMYVCVCVCVHVHTHAQPYACTHPSCLNNHVRVFQCPSSSSVGRPTSSCQRCGGLTSKYRRIPFHFTSPDGIDPSTPKDGI